MPYMLVMMVVLVISWAMMLNIAKLLTDRMILQNAADNAALSVATAKARLLNRLGELNYMIGCTLYGTEDGLNYSYFGATGGTWGLCAQIGPANFQFLTDTQKCVGCTLDAFHGGCPGTDNCLPTAPFQSWDAISSIRALVIGDKTAQDILQLQFVSEFPPIPVNTAMFNIAQGQEVNATNNNSVVDYVQILNPESVLLLDICRNSNGVNYCKTDSFCTSIPPNPIVPTGVHTHIFWTDNWKQDKDSWLYVDKDKFYKNLIITVMAVKKGNSSSNKGYPIFGDWLGIQWPDTYAIATAGIYNRGGPMFPVEKKGNPSDNISPVIKAFKDARNGGWDVHLVRTKSIAGIPLPLDIPVIQH